MTTSIEMPAPDSVEAEGQKSPALDSLEVEGYKSIRSAKIELGRINVLIGANGSGKSNLVGLFGLLADLPDRQLQLHIARQGGADAILHFGAKKTRSVGLSLRFGLHGYKASLVPVAGDTLVFEYELALQWVARAPDQDPLSGDPVPMYLGHGGHAEGDNLAPFLFALRAIAPGAYRRIVEAVRSVAPFFDDFILEPDVINPGVIQLAWRHTMDDGLFTADSLSDGTLRFICLATLLLQPTSPSLIVIDEPELGLHPFAIAQLAAMVRAAATKTQVILATQSVTLLDQFDASEVIVVDRSNGESTFTRLNESALAEWKQDYSLGELWLKNVSAIGIDRIRAVCPHFHQWLGRLEAPAGAD